MSERKLKEQAEQIRAIAEKSGVQSNFLFITTFDRYLMLLEILDELKATIAEQGTTVTKEYIKDKKNIYTHPALGEWNRTVDSANKTVSTLMRIIRNFNVTDEDEEEDPLIAALNGNS